MFPIHVLLRIPNTFAVHAKEDMEMHIRWTRSVREQLFPKSDHRPLVPLCVHIFQGGREQMQLLKLIIRRSFYRIAQHQHAQQL